MQFLDFVMIVSLYLQFLVNNMKLGLVFLINDMFLFEKWNFYYNELYLLNMVFLIIGFLIGMFGNVIVIIVY